MTISIQNKHWDYADPINLLNYPVKSLFDRYVTARKNSERSAVTTVNPVIKTLMDKR